MMERKSSGFLQPIVSTIATRTCHTTDLELLMGVFVQGCNRDGGGDPSGRYDGVDGENDSGVDGVLLLIGVGVHPGILDVLDGASREKSSSIANGSLVSLSGCIAGLVRGESLCGIPDGPRGRRGGDGPGERRRFGEGPGERLAILGRQRLAPPVTRPTSSSESQPACLIIRSPTRIPDREMGSRALHASVSVPPVKQSSLDSPLSLLAEDGHRRKEVGGEVIKQSSLEHSLH